MDSCDSMYGLCIIQSTFLLQGSNRQRTIFGMGTSISAPFVVLAVNLALATMLVLGDGLCPSMCLALVRNLLVSRFKSQPKSLTARSKPLPHETAQVKSICELLISLNFCTACLCLYLKMKESMDFSFQVTGGLYLYLTTMKRLDVIKSEGRGGFDLMQTPW